MPKNEQLILVIDDNLDFLNGLEEQAKAENKQHRFVFLQYGQKDLISQIHNHSSNIFAVFLDFDMGSEFTAKRIMDALGDYLNWNEVRIFWFSGADQLNSTALSQARVDYPRLSPEYLRKPLVLSDIESCLCETFKLAEQWLHFPWPLRVLDKEGQIVDTNQHWQGAINRPDPAAFISNDGFDTETKDFFSELPGSFDGEAGYFRLLSFVTQDGSYLIQYVENISVEVTRNDWLSLVEKIAAALGEMSYTRVRFCRYLNVPRNNENDTQSNDVDHYVLALSWSSTVLGDDKPIGERESPPRIPLKEPLLGRMKQMLTDFHTNENEIIFNITNEDNKGEDREWDKLIVPTENTQGYSIVELPLFTTDRATKDIIGNPGLLGQLTFDRYDSELDLFIEITERDIRRLGKVFYTFCEELAKSMELDIKRAYKSHAQAYARLDDEMTGGLDKPETLLKKLLAHAVEDVQADMGYITEERVGGYQVTISLDRLTLKTGSVNDPNNLITFKDVFYKRKKNVEKFPILRCWQTGQFVFLPDLKQDKNTCELLLQAHDDPKQVVSLNEPSINRGVWQNYYENEVGSILVLPVMAGYKQIAAIILHSKEAYHFDDERLERLKSLSNRASWLLAVSRHSEQRKLLLDGIVHQIKSDSIPLNQYLPKLKVENSSKSAWQRCCYYATQLEMAAKSLLLQTNNENPVIAENEIKSQYKDLVQLLREMEWIFTPELIDRKMTLEFEPSLDNCVWLTQLPMNLNWCKHVIANLLENATKYGKPCKKIKICGSQQKCNNLSGFELKVINQGFISEQQRQQAYNSSYHSAMSDGFHVGLASCKQQMDLCRGEISLDYESESKQVVATVWWPLGGT